MTARLIVFVLATAMLGGCAGSGLDVRAVWHGDDKVAGLTPEEMRANGVEHFRAGRYGLAISSFQAALNAGDQSVEALNGLGASYDRIGRYDLAERAYRRALKIDPQSAQTLNNIGFSYFMRGKMDVASAFLLDAEAVAPDSLAVAVNLTAIQDAIHASQQLMKATEQKAAEPTVEPAALPIYKVERRTAQVQHLVQYREDGRAAVIHLGVQPAEERAVTVAALPPPPLPDRKPAAPAETPPKVTRPAGQPLIELSNGNGRNGMASRTREWLKGLGVTVQRLTNADHFRHEKTTIYYRGAWEQMATSLAEKLPVPVQMKVQDDLVSGIRVELGADLLPFDRNQALTQKEKSNGVSG